MDQYLKFTSICRVPNATVMSGWTKNNDNARDGNGWWEQRVGRTSFRIDCYPTHSESNDQGIDAESTGPFAHSFARTFQSYFARVLRCTHSLTHLLPSSWERGFCPWNEPVDFIQFQPTVLGFHDSSLAKSQRDIDTILSKSRLAKGKWRHQYESLGTKGDWDSL